MKKIFLLFFSVLFAISAADAQTPPFFTSNTGNSNNAFPNNTASSNKVQWIYSPGMFTSGGNGSGTPAFIGLIDTVWFRTASTAAGNFTGFEISMGQTVGTDTVWTNGTYQTTLTSCLGPASYTTSAPGPGNWYYAVLTTPFLYNPSLSLVVEMRQNGYSPGLQTYQISTNAAVFGGGARRIWGGYAATTGSFGTGLADMGISLTSPLPCATPTNGMASYIGTDSVELSWTENNTPPATTWQIEYGVAGFSPTGSPQITTTTNPHGIGGLTQNTAYDFYVRAYCGSNDSSYYFPILNVTTQALCPAPSNLTATNITSSSADLDWTENGTATAWDLEIGLSGFAPTGTPVIPGVTKPYTLAGLPQNTCFDYYVRAACGGTNGNSTWTGPYTFCTSIAPLACPPGAAASILWTESFDNTFTGQTNLPNAAAPGWTGNTIAGNPTWALESNNTGSGSTGPNLGAPGGGNNGYMYLEVSCVSGGNDTIKSPSIDLTGVVGAARVKWFNHMYGPNSGKLEVFVDNGTTLTSIYVDSGQTQASSAAAWDSVVVNLNAFVGQNIQLVYVGTAANPGGCSGDRGVDEISVEGCVSCAAPSNITAIGASATSIDVSWTSNNTPPAGNWAIEAVPSGNPPTGTPTHFATTNPYTVTGLSAFTSYDFYVKAICGPADSSSWAGPATAVACAPLAGNYTVDPSLPASGTNFQTMNAVAVALQCGISAPVVFDMAAGNTFNEQTLFPEVVGASATNTITFNGNGDTVNFATNNTDRYVVRLMGSDYFTFNDVVFEALPASATFYTVHLMGGTNHNNFNNCTFLGSTTSTTFGTTGLAMSGSATSPTTNMAAEADSNCIDSCTFIGGYYGTTMSFQTTSGSNGNQVKNSTFTDYYNCGSYFFNGDEALCSNNEYSRPTRTTLTTFYGVLATGIMNRSLFEKNWVHDPAPASSTASFTSYLLYFLMDAADSANANIIRNNIIEDNQGNGTHYGIYLNNANNHKCYHNTVIHNNQTAGQTGITRGIFQNGTSTLLGLQDIQNNLIYITRNTSGASYGLYKSTYPGTTMDYNNVFGSTSNWNYGFNGGNQVDLAAWQASTPTVGANSLGVDPLFLLPAPNQYLPTNAAMNDLANPGVGVTDDFSGAARSATPDMGALEFVVSNTDIATTAILSPDTSIGCYTANETVMVEISNYGATAHDFSANPTTVTVQVTGTVTATLTATVNTGTLPPLGTLSVPMAPTVNMTANGAYAMQAYSNTVGDPVAFNDTLATIYNYNVNLVAGTISATPDVICAMGTTDVTIAGNAGGLIQWQTSTTGAAPWTNVGSGMNPHTSAVLTSTTYYRAMLTCNSAVDSTNVDTIVVNNPTVATTISDTVCGADTVHLVANPTDTSHLINWYDVPTGGLPLAAGTDTFSTYITGTDTFYASALAGGLGTPMLITEICNFNNASGWATPTPPVPSAITDPVELTNISTSPVDLGGWKIEVVGPGAGSFTIPAGNVVAPNSTFVISRGNSGSPNTPGVFISSPLPTSSSGTAQGWILSDPSGTVMDVVAYNGYAVVGQGTPAATAADWTGAAPSGSGTSGIRRTNVDDTNDGSDWTVAGPSNLVNYGSVNVPFTPGGGCEGTRTAVVAVSTPGPPVVASATDTLVCVGDSTMLMATGAGAGGTYAWNNGGMTGVNFVPPTSPITYTLTGTNSAGCSSIDSVTIVKADTFAGVATASPDLHCITGSSVVDVVQGAFIQWQESSSATGPWTNVGTNSPQYNTGALTSTMYYRALSTCGANTDTSSVDTVIVENPLIASTMGDTICGPNTATLSASLVAGTGNSVSWYDAATGGTKLDTGLTYTTPVISATDTFYAVGSAGAGVADTAQPLGSALSTFSGNVRGYWFTAPTDFTITSLRIPTDVATGNQSIAVLRMNGNVVPPTFPTTTTNHTTLFLTQNNTNNGWLPVNIPILSGEVIGILGQRGTTNTYTSNASMVIDGTTVPTGRFIMQLPLTTNAPGPVSENGATGSISKVDFTYSIGCEGSPRTPVVAVVNPSSGDLALTTTTNASPSVPGTDSLDDMHADGAMLSYYNPTCELIATIADTAGGNALGMVTSKVNVDATVNVVNGQPYARRWYDINPASNGPATVTLYFTQPDFDDFNMHPAIVANQWDSLPSSPTSSTAAVRITKLAGGGIGVGTTSIITPTSVTWNAANLRWEVTFPVDSFSQFHLHTGQNPNNPLSVSLLSFNVVKNGSVSDATWVTAQEENNKHFNVQRSTDGVNFETLGTVATKAPNGYSTGELSYSFTDQNPQIGRNYYRLEQVDNDNSIAYSKTVEIVWGADGSVVTIYPNPVTDKLNIDVSIDKVAQLEVRLLDMSGRVIKSAMQRSAKGVNNITLDVSDITNGVYGVQILENNAIIHTSKVNRQSK